jgi:Ser/Thr protein kinase RdoA (MazF antagonist)
MLRAAHSIFNTADLLDTLRTQFETPPLESCLFFRSCINDTYQFAAGANRYYLRVYQAGWRTRPEVEAEMSAIEAIHAAGGPVALPIPLRKGGFVLDLSAPEAVRPAVLFHEAAGVDLTYDAAEGPANANRYGRAVARLHNATSRLGPPPGRPPLDLHAVLDGPRDIISSRLSDDDRRYFDQVWDRLRRYVLGRQDLTLGFCHGDLNSSNIHFDGDLPTVIDFDCCGWGWLAGDIAAFARGMALHRLPSAEVNTLIGAFLQGYQSERTLAATDREALPAFMLIQRIWVASLHLDGHHRWGNIYFGNQYAQRLMHWLRNWESVLDTRPAWL